MVKLGRNKPRKWHGDLIGTTDHFVPSGKPLPKKLVSEIIKEYARVSGNESNKKSQDA